MLRLQTSRNLSPKKRQKTPWEKLRYCGKRKRNHFRNAGLVLQDELVAKEMKIDLNKGIMLSGPIGCGKTTLFKLMQKLPFGRKNYRITSTRQIVSEFMQTGYDILENYSRGNLYNDNRISKNYCFDDLGTETTSKYFGNDCNVMAEILLRATIFSKKREL